MNRRGFTLLETLVATAIFALVIGTLGTVFVGLGRLVRATYVDAALSLEMREARERILFRTMREGGGVSWGGLLSARDAAATDAGVRYEAAGVQTESGEPSSRANQEWTPPTSGRIVASLNADLAESRKLLFVDLTGSMDGAVRRERVVVPLFGAEQVRNSTHLFHEGATP